MQVLAAHHVYVYTGSLVAQLTSVTEKVEGLHTRLQHKAEKEGLSEAKQQLNSVRQQGQQCSQALAELKGSVKQQGQEQATALNRLEVLVTTCAHGKLLSSACSKLNRLTQSSSRMLL